MITNMLLNCTSPGITGESLAIGLVALILVAIVICVLPGGDIDDNYR